MLEDRDYMRGSSGGYRWSATVTLLVFNAIAFVIQRTLLPWEVQRDYLALSLDGLRHGFLWQVLTFQFLHGDILHLVFNSLAIFFFGRPVEIVLGRARFTQLYFASGVVGGLVQILCALAVPAHFGGPTTAVVGASAGATGLVGAFCCMNWHDRFPLVFLFIPMNIRGKTFFWISFVIAVLGMMSPRSVVAHAAHLGGLVSGYFFVRLGLGVPDFTWNFLRARRRKRDLMKAATVKIPRWPKAEGGADVPEGEFMSREVDPILDKISAQGIQSLTERERKILEAARNKMAKR